MRRGARVVAGACLVALTLPVWPQATARKGVAAGPSASAAARAASASAAAASAPTEFTGALVTGTTYAGEFFYDSRALKIWRPVKEVQPGKNVAWTIHWTNLDQFPALKSAPAQARKHRFRFRVVKTDMVSGSPQLPWMVTYRCEILAAEPVAAPPSPATKRR
ncbi:MAG: hypothetical protein ACXWUL_09380 [Caldimonas sp.]